MTALSEVGKQINTEFGEGSLIRLGSRKSVPIKAISTGSLTLDRALGVGGIAQGRVAEIFGPDASGKTTLLYHLIANAQKDGGTCAFIDAEHALDPSYAKTIGVNTDDLWVDQPDYGEMALEIVDRLVKSCQFALVVIDSVDALTPRMILEGEMGDATVGRHPQLMSQALRKIAPAAARTGTTVVFTNQIRSTINTIGFGPNETQPGGRALKFYASQRLDIRRIETLKHGEEAVGNRCRVKVVKNKVAAPFRKAEFVIRYGVGVSSEDSLIDLGLELDLIKKSGAFLDVPGVGKCHGREKAVKSLREQHSASESLSQAIGERLNA